MHAKRYDLKRVFFGGFFIRGHPYTMETISFAIKFWSQVRAGWYGWVQYDRHLVGASTSQHQVLEPGSCKNSSSIGTA
jgi:pantothenate kinase